MRNAFLGDKSSKCLRTSGRVNVPVFACVLHVSSTVPVTGNRKNENMSYMLSCVTIFILQSSN